MQAKATGSYSVRYCRGSRKWYRAILEIGYKSIRVSKKTFKRAWEAEEYRSKVLGRLKRMKGG